LEKNVVNEYSDYKNWFFNFKVFLEHLTTFHTGAKGSDLGKPKMKHFSARIRFWSAIGPKKEN
jgi:hypothetical protein